MSRLYWLVAFALFVGCRAEKKPAAESMLAPAATEEESEMGPLVPTDRLAAHYEIEMENEHARVLRVSYAAGDRAPSHTHLDGLLVFLEAGAARARFDDGSEEVRSGRAGDVRWVSAEAHTFEAATDVAVIFVEVLSGEGEGSLSEHHGTLVDPRHNEVVFENDRVRVIRATYPSGYRSPLHDYLPGVTVMLTAYRLTSGGEGEPGVEAEGRAGDVWWNDARPPSVAENGGEAELSFIRVEMKGVTQILEIDEVDTEAGAGREPGGSRDATAVFRFAARFGWTMLGARELMARKPLGFPPVGCFVAVSGIPAWFGRFCYARASFARVT